MRQRVNLREYLERRINDLQDRIASERTLLREAGAERQAEMERRLNALNDLRKEVLADRDLFVTKVAFGVVQTRVENLMPRESYDEQHKALVDKVEQQRDQIVKISETVASMRARAAAYFSALGIAIAVLGAALAILQIALAAH